MSLWMQALLGIALAVAGVYVAVESAARALASVGVLAVEAIEHGIAQIIAGFRMRRLHLEIEIQAAPRPSSARGKPWLRTASAGTSPADAQRRVAWKSIESRR